MAHLRAEYIVSMNIRGDSTEQNARKAENGRALNAKELYPHLKVTTIEESAKELYQRQRQSGQQIHEI